MKEEEKVPLTTALATILIVSCCLWGAVFAGWYVHHRQQEKRRHDDRYLVKRIAARSTTQDRLPLGVLTEMLSLDRETPISLFDLQPQEVKRTLLSCSAFAKVRAWRLLPGTLGIEYTLRTPVATIAGIKNVGIDATATPFFLFPYYAPKRLPAIVIPMANIHTLYDLQKRVRRIKETAIGLKLLERLIPIADRHHLDIDLIDLTRLRHQSVFRREMIMAFASPLSRGERLFVRFHVKKMVAALDLLPAIMDTALRNGLKTGTIDLRYEGMAILSGEIAHLHC